jgi:hypothetical protein
LGDQDKSLWDAYVEGGGRPQYVVFDRDLNIVFKGKGPSGHGQAEEAVLDLLD